MIRLVQLLLKCGLPLLLLLLLAACGNGIADNGMVGNESAGTESVDNGVEGETAVQTTPSSPAAATAVPDPITADTNEADEAAGPAEPDQPDESAATQQATRFELDPNLSEARFYIGEILRGEPFTVVGVTNQVSGELTIDLAHPAQTEVGEILVDAGTLVTDNNMRNRAIYNFVLNTSQFQFVRFTPVSLHDLPQTIEIGQTVEFQIEGELTIRDVTQTVLFEAVVDLVSEQEIRGQASTVILREDFNLTIPSVPQVAGVDEELTVEIEFVATAVP